MQGKVPTTETVIYAPEVFNARNIDDARHIILMPDRAGDLTTDKRWQLETDWILERIAFPPDALVIDYGCGIGRIAKRLSWPVLGVDISWTMRAMATGEMAAHQFAAMPPDMLVTLVEKGLRAQGALAMWVLQHAIDPEQDIDLLARALDPGSPLWILNSPNRIVPCREKCVENVIDWADDGKDITPLLAKAFDVVAEEELPPSLDPYCSKSILRRHVRR